MSSSAPELPQEALRSGLPRAHDLGLPRLLIGEMGAW